MSTIRFLLIGGFLGAGKTTTIARLARAYLQDGLNVGIITNDEAAHLVDTYNLRSQGLEVGEVAGACFCCRFGELTRVIDSLQTKHPDVILAEPIGSAADLVATVIQPLRKLYGEKLDIAPHGVILKPSHGRKVKSECKTQTADLLLNARVALAPELLQKQIECAVERACAALSAGVVPVHLRSMRPCRPVPTHRSSEPLA